jgi:hypothetical protein
VLAWRLKEFEEWDLFEGMAAVLVDLNARADLVALQEVAAVELRRKMVLPLDDEVEVGNPAVKKVVVGMVALAGDSGYNIFGGLVEVGELAMDNLHHNLGCGGRSMQVESVSLRHPRGSRNPDRI